VTLLKLETQIPDTISSRCPTAVADPGSTGNNREAEPESDSGPGPGPGPVPNPLSTSDIIYHPSQTRDSNPNPPIGDFDYSADLDISSNSSGNLYSN